MDGLIVFLIAMGVVVISVVALVVVMLMRGYFDEPPSRVTATPKPNPQSRRTQAEKEVSRSRPTSGSAPNSPERRTVKSSPVATSRPAARDAERVDSSKQAVPKPKPSPSPMSASTPTPQNTSPQTASSDSPAARPRAVSGVFHVVAGRWSEWSTTARGAAIGAPVALAVVVVAVTLAIVGSSRDEGSYQYGRSQESVSARQFWNAVNNVGIDKSNLRSVEDACARTVDADRNADNPKGESMRKMNRDDIIDGCTDVLEDEQRHGYLP